MIYKFETDCCPMCKQAERLLKKHKVKYQVVNASQHDAMVEFYGIRSVPCLIAAESLGENALNVCRAPQSEVLLIQFLSECAKLNIPDIYEDIQG